MGYLCCMKNETDRGRRAFLLTAASWGLAGPTHAAPWAQQPWTALTHWSRLQLQWVVKRQQNPLRAARAMAYLHQALLGGWRAGVSEASGPAFALGSAHHAAACVLERLYPNETPGLCFAQATALAQAAGLDAAGQRRAAQAGETAAQPLLQRSLRDGAGRVWSPAMRPAPFDGMWQPSPPLNQVNPAEGMAPHWRLWLRDPAALYDPPPAARPGQARFDEELREVRDVARQLSPAQAAAAEAWHLDAGSVTPPGVWLRLALDAAGTPDDPAAIGNGLQTLALLACAMHDALVGCWRVKLRDWSERPVTAVRRLLDPGFTPLLVTPGFPGYVSGHASVSAAAAEVLAQRLPTQDGAWHTQAHEAAASRLWGGIHFRSDNDEGLRLGRSVGQATLAQADPDHRAN